MDGLLGEGRKGGKKKGRREGELRYFADWGGWWISVTIMLLPLWIDCENDRGYIKLGYGLSAKSDLSRARC